MKKIIILILLCLTVPRVYALDLAPNSLSAIIIDMNGNVLYEKNSHEKLPPASMTKMMSMLLIIEGIESGMLNWDDMVTASANASSMGGSQILLETGEEMSVSDLFKGVAVASGNDAVVALAEALYGDVAVFVDKMNERAKQLGLTDTYFKNPHGLNDTNHYSSAYDMAVIAKELARHPKVFEYTSIYEDYLRSDTNRKFWLVNTNKLVRFYKGVDGFKTGYTNEALYCLTATANKGFRVIAVVMGEPTSELRNKEVSSMLDYAYATYRLDTILKKDEVIKRAKPILSKDEYVNLVSKDDVAILNKKEVLDKEYSYNVKVNELVAPIKKGDVVGSIEVMDGDNIILEGDITVDKDVKKANIFELYLKNLKKMITV